MKVVSAIMPIIFLFLVSCKNNIDYDLDSNNKIVIKSPQNVKRFEVRRYSEIFDSIKIVPLESSDSILVGRVDKVVIYNDKIFVLDQTESKAVFEFDVAGRFIRRIGHVGWKFGEFKEPNDISVNNGEVSIWVHDQRKFVIYDMNGNCLREVNVATMAKSGVRISADKFATYLDIGGDVLSREKFDLRVFDDNNKKTYVGFEKKDQNYSKGIFFISQNRNQFLVSPGYSNDLYEIDTNKNVLHKKYSIDLGKYRLPDDFATKYPTFISFDKGLSHSNYAYITDYWDTPNYLVYSFSYKGLIYDVYYSKRTKQIRYGNAWFNNVYGIIVGANKGAYDDNIIAVYDPANIESYQKSLTTKRTKEQTDSLSADANRFYNLNGKSNMFVPNDFAYSQAEINIIQTIKPNHNPVILIAKLKYF